MSVEWKTLGSCVDHYGRLDWIEPANDAAAAESLQICAGCPVRGQCLTEAMKVGEEGIWGGTTAEQRQALAEADGIEIPRQLEHGTRTAYVKHHCRCDNCTAVHRRWTQDYRARRRRPDPYSTPIVLLRRRGRSRPGQYLLPLDLSTTPATTALAA